MMQWSIQPCLSISRHAVFAGAWFPNRHSSSFGPEAQEDVAGVQATTPLEVAKHFEVLGQELRSSCFPSPRHRDCMLILFRGR